MEGGGDAAVQLTADMRETGEVMANTFDARIARENMNSLEATFEGLKRIFGKGREAFEDIGPLLDKAGISVIEFNRATAGGAEGQDRWARAVAAANLSGEDQDALLEALSTAQRVTARRSNATPSCSGYSRSPSTR